MNTILASLTGLAIALIAHAQQTPPPQPPLLACGMHGDYEVLCGTRSPEDIEVAPDGKHLIVSEYVSFRGGTGGSFSLFDPVKKTLTKIAITNEPRKDWGDPACPGPPGDALAPHGISLSKRSPGNIHQLYVVNHGGRESIEMFEVKQTAGTLSLAWHGCVVSTKDFNDVAALANGGFYGTQSHRASHPGSGHLRRSAFGLGRQLDARKRRSRIARHPPGLSQRRDRDTRRPHAVLQRVDGKRSSQV